VRGTEGARPEPAAVRGTWQRYAVALLVTAVALGLRALLTPLWGDALPYFTLYPAVLVAAWYGGLGPGVVATMASTLTATVLWVHPRWTADPHDVASIVGVVGFVVLNAAVCVLVARLRRANEIAGERMARHAFLARASAELGASNEADEALRALVRLVVPGLADWCSVDIVDPGGAVRRLAVAHADASNTAVAERAATYPPDPHGRHPRTQVLRTGRCFFVADVTDEGLTRVALDDEHLRSLRSLGYRSAMIVALEARGRVVGALSLATSTSGRVFGPDDLAQVEDLARRAAVAVENARLLAEAQEANRIKEDILATVSHELRTPLQAILGWVHVLRQGKLAPERFTRALDIMERAGRAQARLIEDLLDVSRIVAGKLALESRPVNLASIVRQVLDEQRPAADEKQVRVRAELGSGVDVIAGDPTRLRQVIANLLGNALKFTPSGGQVVVRLESAGDDVRLLVKDTGEGVRPEFLPHVFEAFRQANASARRRHGGLGLGLAIVRQVVELHGGRVEARSEGEGRGAEFIVTLPLARVVDTSVAVPATGS